VNLGRVAVGFVLLLAYASASSSEDAGHQQDQAVPDNHAAHRAAMQKTRYAATTENYATPDVELIDQLGTSVSLRALLETDQPIALNFIFTTCTTICPVMTATFAQMRRELGDAGEQLRLVSISIDPEYDRPDKLKAYSEQFHAGSGWDFLTGDSADIVQVLRSFDSYAGSKMNHQPVTLLKSPDSESWTRLEGLASGKDLANEVTARLLN
jgi:protein SCO1/2